MADSDAETSLTLVDVVPPDAGIYECVAKNTAGETRCKARLNMILAKTGKDAESGPKLEAPRFSSQIQPVVGQEGGHAEFRSKYTGEPGMSVKDPFKNKDIFIEDVSVIPLILIIGKYLFLARVVKQKD